MGDLGNDERIKQLYEQIQQKKDPVKLAKLVEELLRLNEVKLRKPADDSGSSLNIRINETCGMVGAAS
jgi:hypothetical protein